MVIGILERVKLSNLKRKSLSIARLKQNSLTHHRCSVKGLEPKSTSMTKPKTDSYGELYDLC